MRERESGTEGRHQILQKGANTKSTRTHRNFA